MLHLPAMPDWDALHPLVVHFPIGLLIAVPVVLVAGLIFRKQQGGLFLSALILMLLGTAAAYVSVATGEAAAQVADRTPQVIRLISQHETMAEQVRLFFTILTVAWLAVMLVLRFGGEKMPGWVRLVLPVLFLPFYLLGMIHLANMSHEGGRLVHDLGVHVTMTEPKK